MRDWLGQTQNFICNMLIEERDPKAKKKRKKKEGIVVAVVGW